MDQPFPVGMITEIENFLRDDKEKRPAGLDLYPDVFDTRTFFPLQRKGELTEMIRIARSIQPKIVAEIGCDKGGGLYHWCKIPSVEIVIACEIRGTPYKHLFEKAFDNIGFLWGERSSLDREWRSRLLNMMKEWKGALMKKSRVQGIDVLFIDGDKLGMEKDFDAYLPLMNPNGIVFFHDVQDRHPKESYWNVRARGYAGEVIVNLEDTQEALRRAELNLPVKNEHEGWLRYWKGRSCGVGVVYLGKEERSQS